MLLLLIPSNIVETVGIEESLKEVTDILEWGSKENVGGVIIYGFGWMRKTTLADVVFSWVEFQGCQYSKVQLFHNRILNPQIVELQKIILQDLTGSKNIPEIRKDEDG